MKKYLFVLVLAFVFLIPGVSSGADISESYKALRQDPTWAATIYAKDSERSGTPVLDAPWGSDPVADLKGINEMVNKYDLQYRGVWKTFLPDGAIVLAHLFAYFDGDWKYFALVPREKWLNRYDMERAVTTFEKAEDEFVDLISLKDAVESCYSRQRIVIGAEGRLYAGKFAFSNDRPRAFLVNGKEVVLPYYMIHGFSYTGVKTLASLLGVSVQFSDNGREAKVGNVTFRTGFPTRYGITRYEHALVVPLRDFCEAIGATVIYNPCTDTVNILTPDGKGPFLSEI